MSKLAEAVAAERASRRRSECQVGVLLKQLAATKVGREIAADLDVILANGDISAPEISRGLKRLGHELSPSPVARHRRGDCVCPR